MKYSTFARLRIAAIAAVVVVPVLAWFGCQKTSPSAPPPQPVAQQQLPPALPPNNGGNAGNSAPVADTAAFTDVHRAILRLQKEPLSNGQAKGGTIQWVYNDAGIRAEFRSDKDKGFDYWNRVKIDYNGNKRDDERWDFKKDGTVKRRVAPNDDENFTETYSLSGETWVRK